MRCAGFEREMIKLNRITDYAVVVLAQMAREPESNVPLPTVAKVLKELARDGVLASHRGANGGYTLARKPEEISVLSIIRSLEGPIALTSCVDDSDSDCGVESLCPVRGNWNQVNKAIRNALDSVSLAEMAVSTLMFDAPPAPQGEMAPAADKSEIPDRA